MRSVLVLAFLVAAPFAAQAQSLEGYAAPMREHARASGWVREDTAEEERWCPRPGGCSATGPDVLVVSTHGVSRAVLHRRTDASGWTVSVSLGFWEANPPTFTLRFERGADVLEIGWELHSPPLADGTSFSRTGAEESGDFHAWLAAELPAYLVSADALRDRVVARSEALRAHLHRVIASASMCPTAGDPGRFVCVPMPEGHAMMDTCTRRTLSAEEQAAFLAEADAMLDARNRIARDHAAALFPLLAALFAP